MRSSPSVFSVLGVALQPDLDSSRLCHQRRFVKHVPHQHVVFFFGVQDALMPSSVLTTGSAQIRPRSGSLASSSRREHPDGRRARGPGAPKPSVPPLRRRGGCDRGRPTSKRYDSIWPRSSIHGPSGPWARCTRSLVLPLFPRPTRRVFRDDKSPRDSFPKKSGPCLSLQVTSHAGLFRGRFYCAWSAIDGQ